ncbi:MAG: glycosyltransferase [Acidobacteriota bacterium]
MGQALNIAVVGTRGIPANYGGFETFAQELSTRLAERGHRVTVYGRSHYVDPGLSEFGGVSIRVLPAIRHKYLETVSHTALSLLSTLGKGFDVVLICNAANAFISWVPRLAGARVVLNVDGIERKRRKWNLAGKAFYLLAERLATWLPQQVVTDAKAIQRYYLEKYGCQSCFIPYGASTQKSAGIEALKRLGIEPGRYLLCVSRLEPENNAHLVLEAYKRTGIPFPLLLVGDAPYSRRYIEDLKRAAAGANVLMPGAIFGEGYRELISHCLCYFQASEVGGTHPALIEAMGAGALAVVNDTPENREVVGDSGLLLPFRDLDRLAGLMEEICAAPQKYESLRCQARQRVARSYDWEKVVDQYEELFHGLVNRDFTQRRRDAERRGKDSV